MISSTAAASGSTRSRPSQHQQAMEGLVVRLGGGQVGQIRHHVGAVTEFQPGPREVGAGAGPHHGQPRSLASDVLRRRHVCERLAAPQIQRTLQRSRPIHGPGSRPGLLDQPLGGLYVGDFCTGGGAQPVARRLRRQSDTGGKFGSQRGQMALQRAHRGRRRPPRPQGVHQLVHVDRFAHPQPQHRQQRAQGTAPHRPQDALGDQDHGAQKPHRADVD